MFSPRHADASAARLHTRHCFARRRLCFRRRAVRQPLRQRCRQLDIDAILITTLRRHAAITMLLPMPTKMVADAHV